jgi:hypothetical protein
MRYPPRGVIPPGKAGLVILAAAVVPVVVKNFRPFAKTVGQGFVAMGEKIKEAAKGKSQEEVQEEFMQEAAADQPDVETASPMGQAEVEAQEAAVDVGKQAVEKLPEKKKRKTGAKAGTKDKPNPKTPRRKPGNTKTGETGA